LKKGGVRKDMITGKTAVTGLIGNPVAHTMSPLIHNTLAADYSVDLTYMAFRS
jgi:shikimate 5-dehydrogenase